MNGGDNDSNESRSWQDNDFIGDDESIDDDCESNVSIESSVDTLRFGPAIFCIVVGRCCLDGMKF